MNRFLNSFFAQSICCFTLLCSLQANSQLSISDLETERIHAKHLVNYLHEQEALKIKLFQEFEVSWKVTTDTNDFVTYKREFLVMEQLEKVWETYAGTNPSISWKSSRSDLGLMYDRNRDRVLYAEDSIPALQPGNLLFVNLKLLKGLYKMATAFEVTEISREKARMELSYIETGVARGKQSIFLEATEEGFTKVTHITKIKSDSKFRDKVIYPFFHNKIINEFHKNMNRLALSSDESLYQL
jgi:hypothetical protein